MARVRHESAANRRTDGHTILTWIIAATAAAVTFVCFLPALNNGFVWDDHSNVVKNLGFRGWGSNHLRWMFTTLHGGPYQPLTWLSFALDYSAWGMNPRGYHLTNLLLHSVNGALFFMLCSRLLILALPKNDKHSEWILLFSAVMAALSFSIHPLRVESVAWVTERRDILSGTFYLLALLAYLRPGREGTIGPGAIILFLCALLSKAIVITMPFVFLILDFFPLRRISSQPGSLSPNLQILREKIPVLSIATLFAVVGYIGQREFGNMPTLGQFDLLQRLAQSAFAPAYYVLKSVVPTGLLPLYERPESINPFQWRFISSACLIGAASFLAYRSRLSRPWLTAAWAYYLVTLAPVIGLLSFGPQIAADRYTYLPSMGISMIFAAGFFYLASRIPSLLLHYSLGLILVFGLGRTTWAQTKVWHDDITLWQRVLASDPESAYVNFNLGTSLMEKRRLEEARIHLEKAVQLRPEELNQRYNLAVVLENMGQFDAALAEFRELTTRKHDFPPAHYHIALILEGRSDLERALYHFSAAAKSPRLAKANFRAGKILFRLKRMEDAISAYKAGLESMPDDAAALSDLGGILAGLGRISEATEALERAARLAPNTATVQFNLAGAYRLAGRRADAIARYETALRLDPSNRQIQSALDETRRLRTPETAKP